MGISYFLEVKHCYNFIFCFILTVHGDIRHLEIHKFTQHLRVLVHGDIRHLENSIQAHTRIHHVHGDIRHLENVKKPYHLH